MSIRIEPLKAGPASPRHDDPIHVIIAGYRSRPNPTVVAAAHLSGSVYGAIWAAGRWADAGASATMIARATQVSVPAFRAGRLIAGVTSLAGGAGGAIAIGAGQFRHRYWCAQRDGLRLADALSSIPDVRGRPIHLHGHSLGTVVIRQALPGLCHRGLDVQNVCLMGGAAPRRGWADVADAFTGQLFNLYSAWDRVLNIAPVFGRVVGNGEIDAAESRLAGRLINIDLADRLPSAMNPLAHHSGYWKHFGAVVGGLTQ